MQTTEIEVAIMIDQDGDYVIHKDADELGDTWDNEIGGSTPRLTRVVVLKLTVPLPKALVAEAAIPDTDGPVSVTVTA